MAWDPDYSDCDFLRSVLVLNVLRIGLEGAVPDFEGNVIAPCRQ